MKLALVLVLCLNLPAVARMGETREQCIERYGNPSAAAEGVLRFKHENLAILVTFNEKGKVDGIEYSGAITEEEAIRLRNLNTPKAWVEGKSKMKLPHGKAWLTDDKELSCIFLNSPEPEVAKKLSVLTYDWRASLK